MTYNYNMTHKNLAKYVSLYGTSNNICCTCVQLPLSSADFTSVGHDFFCLQNVLAAWPGLISVQGKTTKKHKDYVVANQSLLISPSSLFISAIGLCRLWRPMYATIPAVCASAVISDCTGKLCSTFLHLTVLINASIYNVPFSGIKMFHFRAWNP